MRYRRRILVASVAAALAFAVDAALERRPELLAERVPSARDATPALGAAAREGQPGRGSRAIGRRPSHAASPAARAALSPETQLQGELVAVESTDTATASVLRIEDLERVEGSTAALRGYDTGGPRKLLLWEVVNGRSALLARGRSLPGGALDFPVIVVPRDGIELVVTPYDDDPDGWSASAPWHEAPRAARAPSAQLLRWEDERAIVRVRPAESDGLILVADSHGTVFAELAISRHPTAAGRIFDMEVTVPESDTEILLAHELPDGRVSPWGPLSFAPPEGEVER